MSFLLEVLLYILVFIFCNFFGKNILKENEFFFDILKFIFEDYLVCCYDSVICYRGNMKWVLIGYKYLMECFGILWILCFWGYYF